jgi:hypothetical protein
MELRHGQRTTERSAAALIYSTAHGESIGQHQITSSMDAGQTAICNLQWPVQPMYIYALALLPQSLPAARWPDDARRIAPTN